MSEWQEALPATEGDATWALWTQHHGSMPYLGKEEASAQWEGPDFSRTATGLTAGTTPGSIFWVIASLAGYLSKQSHGGRTSQDP